MRKAIIVAKNSLGFHARASAKFSLLAKQFESEITLGRKGLRVNGKSIQDVMMLAIETGAEVMLIAKGPDEDRAIEVLERLVEVGFFELGKEDSELKEMIDAAAKKDREETREMLRKWGL